jgi:hypothetical protein
MTALVEHFVNPTLIEARANVTHALSKETHR